MLTFISICSSGYWHPRVRICNKRIVRPPTYAVFYRYRPIGITSMSQRKHCCGSGSGIRCLFDPGIRDGWKIKIRIRDKHFGSYFQELWNNFLGLNSLIRMRIRESFWPWIRDLEWKKELNKKIRVTFRTGIRRSLPIYPYKSRSSSNAKFRGTNSRVCKTMRKLYLFL